MATPTHPVYVYVYVYLGVLQVEDPTFAPKLSSDLTTSLSAAVGEPVTVVSSAQVMLCDAVQCCAMLCILRPLRCLSSNHSLLCLAEWQSRAVPTGTPNPTPRGRWTVATAAAPPPPARAAAAGELPPP